MWQAISAPLCTTFSRSGCVPCLGLISAHVPAKFGGAGCALDSSPGTEGRPLTFRHFCQSAAKTEPVGPSQELLSFKLYPFSVQVEFSLLNAASFMPCLAIQAGGFAILS